MTNKLLLATNELVFTKTVYINEEPFTTSEIIAKHSENQHHAVQQLIVTHSKRLETLGVIAFEMRKPPKGSKGGRPKKIYLLNEEQATLLITFLDNSDVVADFKLELVKQFFEMKKELMTRRIQRELEKPIRKTLTDAIKEWEFCNKWSYRLITDLICKSITGKSTKQLKQEREVKKNNSGTDIFTSEEFAQYNILETKVITLLEMSMTYEQIKTVLSGNAFTITMTAQKNDSPTREPSATQK